MAELEAQHRAVVRGIVAHHAVSRDEADDLYQLVWLQIIQALHDYRGVGPIGRWVKAITRRACLKARRDSGRQQRRLCSLSEISNPIAATCERENDVDMDTVYDAVVALPERQRTLFLMRAYGGASIRELSVRFGIAEGTVKATLAAARAAVRNRLRPS